MTSKIYIIIVLILISMSMPIVSYARTYIKEYKDGGAYDLEYTNIIITKGKVKTEYKIDYISTLDSSHAIDDIDIFSIRDLTNEQGEEIKLRMDENNWLNCIERLAFSDDDEVGKSERFIREHPNINGIIPNAKKEFPKAVDLYKLDFDIEKSDFNKKTIYCNVYYDILKLWYCYRIEYTLDSNGYLDTYVLAKDNSIIDVKYNSTDNYPVNNEVVMRLCTKNRNWDNLPLTSNFRSLHNSNDGLFPYIEILHIYKKYSKDNANKVSMYILDFNKNKYFFGLTFKIVDNLIDDVEITPLDIKEFPAGDAAFDLF